MRLQIDQEQKEIKSHGSYGFPVLISYERLSSFDTGEFPWHWHPEIELTFVMEGDIAYQVNDSIYHLKAGEGLFCNTNVLHRGRGYRAPDCSYLSITFHPRILYGYSSSVIQDKYMNHILRSPGLASLHFVPEKKWQRKILRQMEKIRGLNREHPVSEELQIQMALLKIWRGIYEHVGTKENRYAENGRDTERIRRIMEYIQEHYGEKITLEELAEQIHLCKSESCRLFKRYMNESMFDYLLGYRVERSLDLLRQSSLDVTQIAGQVGFGNPGYYARIFKRKMGCTPLEYRKSRTGGKS
ncbi:MAG: AraC family transcriptional regulator [Lachnospiraceae bacterium]|jgi:AraC-type DNA-binding domain-containing proteins|nr:AraC family transcriptional regulator [Lachnospiraceae bacterium]MCI9659459.1 AraC family transcriptional regulator [Lachnospiraceae bacterium]